MSLNTLLSARRVLLLQGPMGGFFSTLATFLRSRGVVCHKVNFNGGDKLFFHDSFSMDFRASLADFPAWLSEKVQELDIDAIVCFGDCRLYHIEAKKIASDKKIKFLVFEEGYLRPDYITLEVDGVNAHSMLKAADVLDYEQAHDQPQPVLSSFGFMIWCACLYYLAWMVMHWYYPYYKHHRLLNPFQELVAWLRALYRRINHYIPDHIKQYHIRQYWSYQYYIVALQVHNDSQVRVHSHYQDVSEFIEETMRSFARYADTRHKLVVKHHPMDRGYRNYRPLIRRLSQELGLSGRVLYVCDVHLPTLIKRSLGLVTINSTTGLQALFHHKPVKVMGQAIYDLPRLTAQGTLDDFWCHSGVVDRDYYLRFRELLLKKTQLNGSFYGRSPWMESAPYTMQKTSSAPAAPPLMKHVIHERS